MNGKLLLAGIAGTAALAVGGSRRWRASFEQTHHSVKVKGLAEEHDGLVVAQISDLHVGWSTPAERIRAAVRTINASGADLVALTGDYITNHESAVPRLGEQLRGFRLPAVAVLGNHDHWTNARGVTQQLEGIGCTVLRNAHHRLKLKGAWLNVIGIDDQRSGHDDVDAAFEGVAKGSRLVLTHSPPTAQKLPEDAGLLCLTGHTHGGQIHVPGLTRRLLQHVGQPYVRGMHRVNGNHLYVNRGLGYGIGGAALRIGSKPEIAYFTLRRA
jgi:predicted MPP superfamily phosphohydrolase